MHVHLDRTPFLKALQHQQGIVERKVAMPVLSHVLLRTLSDGLLEIVGTDLELTLVQKVSATVHEAGALTVAAHLLYEIVRKCPEGQAITMCLDKSNALLSLTCGASSFHLPTLLEEGYPSVAEHRATHTFTLAGKDLKRLIDQTRFAMSGEEARFCLNGIYLHAQGSNLKAVATDTHRLALSWLPLPSAAEGLRGTILSRKTVMEVRKLIDVEDASIEAAFSATQVAFSYGLTTFYARFVNGTFPEYSEAIPQDNACVLTLNTHLFREAVDRVSVISAQEKVRPIRLVVEKEKISLSAKGMDNGSGAEEVPIIYEGDTFSISFNARYILDAVQQIKGTSFSFHFKNAQTPVILKDTADPQVLYVLMPVRAHA